MLLIPDVPDYCRGREADLPEDLRTARREGGHRGVLRVVGASGRGPWTLAVGETERNVRRSAPRVKTIGGFLFAFVLYGALWGYPLKDFPKPADVLLWTGGLRYVIRRTWRRS